MSNTWPNFLGMGTLVLLRQNLVCGVDSSPALSRGSAIFFFLHVAVPTLATVLDSHEKAVGAPPTYCNAYMIMKIEGVNPTVPHASFKSTKMVHKI